MNFDLVAVGPRGVLVRHQAAVRLLVVLKDVEFGERAVVRPDEEVQHDVAVLRVLQQFEIRGRLALLSTP